MGTRGRWTMDNATFADSFFPDGEGLQINDEDVENAWALLSDLAPDDLLLQEYASLTQHTLVSTVNATAPLPLVPVPVPILDLELSVKSADKKRRRARPTEEQLGRKLTRRESNTLCEARRRDKLNECIEELAKLAQLPYKPTNKDKCMVLSHVAAVLRTRKQVNARLDAAVAAKISSTSGSQAQQIWIQQDKLGIFILSLQMQVVDVNPALHNVLGFGTANEMKKQFGNGMSFVHPDFVGQIYMDMAKLLAGEVQRIQHHERLKCKGNGFKWFMTSVALGELDGQPVVYGVAVETQAPGCVMQLSEDEEK